MKKVKALFFICFCSIIMLLSACQQTPPPNESMTDDMSNGSNQTIKPTESTAPSTDPDSTDDDSAAWLTPAGDIDMDGMNLYWQRDNLQFVGDENAMLSIYVKADKNDKGEFGSDDGQDWLVLLETSLGNYPIFPREYVQLGGVSCVVFNDYADDAAVSHVIVTVQQTADYKI